MTFAQPVPYASLEEAVRAIFGADVRIAAADGVSGGDINRAFRLTLTDGTSAFMKSNTTANLPFFIAEAEGLAAISAAGRIRTPELLGIGTDPHRGSFLLLSWVTSKPESRRYWENFGHALAALHLADTSEIVGGRFGFPHDNFIGAGNQFNAPRDKWTDFFRDQRLVPMFRTADQKGYFDAEDRRRMTSLLDRLDEYLTEPARPSLLHGDLWAGNFITGEDGEAWLIDPATYVGHAETDLAMTELFGGFSPVFYEAYKEILPLQPGYGRRRDLYNLYHLLNHLNLFGSAYRSSVQRILRTYA